MLWGIVTRSNVDYAELLWEEFVQAIQIFFAYRANLNIPTKKPTPHVILYCWFTKLIIYYLGSEHNDAQRLGLCSLTEMTFFLKYQVRPQGEKDSFWKAYSKRVDYGSHSKFTILPAILEMVARKPTAKKGEQKKTTSKADKPKRHAPVKQLTLAEQTKLVKEKTSKLTLSKKIRNDKVMKVRKEKRYDLIVDEEDEEPQVEDDEYNLQRERGENVSNTVALEERTIELDEGQARSDPGKTPESQPPPKRVLMEEYQAGSNPGQSHVVLAGPNPEPMHYNLLIQFNASMYMQASKHTNEDHFLNDKPTKEEPGKANVETEVKSMVTVPIHQASSSAPLLSTPIINLIPPKPVSPPA
ncbi:hypothetical protein Tco_1310824 [Tanacetum coccineum]